MISSIRNLICAVMLAGGSPPLSATNEVTVAAQIIMPPTPISRTNMVVNTNPPAPIFYFAPCLSNAPCQITELYQDGPTWRVDAKVRLQSPTMAIQRSMDLTNWTSLGSFSGVIEIEFQMTDAVPARAAFYRAEVTGLTTNKTTP